MLVHKKTTLYYIWDSTLNMYHTIDTRGNAPLHNIIGETLANLMTHDNDYLQGIQLIRLQIGNSKILARKRMQDIEVTIDTTYNN